MSPARLGVLGALLLAGTLVLLLVWTGEEVAKPASAEPEEAANRESSELSGQADAGSDSRPARDVLITDTDRAPIARVILAGHVQDEARVAIEAATVSWSPLLREAFVENQVLPSDLRDVLRARTLLARTDGEGRFSFAESPMDGENEGSVLWVTRPGFRAEAALIDGGTMDPVQFVLQSSELYRVKVVDSQDMPVSGAIVEQCGLRPPARLQHDPRWRAAARSFLRREVSGEDGYVADAFTPALVSMALQAHAGAAMSAPWLQYEDIALDPIVLRLAPRFTVDGRVESLDSALLDGLRIQCLLDREGFQVVVADANVSLQGSWGPISVPWQRDAKYVVRLSGGDALVQDQRLHRPDPYEHIHLVFEASRAISVHILVQNNEGLAVPGAEVALTWEPQGGSPVTLFAYSDQAGTVSIGGIRPGFVRIRGRAMGFADALLDWRELLETVEAPVVITLERETSLRGRVLHGGEAVRDFTVVWWTDALFAGRGAQAELFRDCEDGAFELPGLPATKVRLMATADGLSCSQAVALDLKPGTVQTVTLELQSACRARGQVVDGSTGHPVKEASVQLWMNTGPDYIHPRGVAVAVDGEGRFELDGLAPGDNRFVVDALGYARHLGTAVGQASNVADLGPIPVLQLQPLEVVLVAEEPMDFSGWSVKFVGTAFEGPIAFDVQGVARFDRCSPGWTRVLIEDPGGGSQVHSVHLLPGQEWQVEVPVAAGATLEVIVEPIGTSDLPEGLWIEVLHGPESRHSGNWSRRSTRADRNGRALFRGVPIGDLVVQVWDEGGTVAAAQVGRLATEGSRITVALTERSHQFQVLYPDGRPVVGAEVHVASPSEAPGWFVAGTTDALGLAEIWYLPVDHVLVSAVHPDAGRVFDVDVDVSADPSPTLLVLDADAAIHARLMSGNTPLGGVGVTILAAGGTYIVGSTVSNLEGIVHLGSLSKASYELLVTHPGFWPQVCTVAARIQADPIPLQVHRLVSLELRARVSTGAAVAGLHIGLIHQGLDHSVEEWIDEGLVDTDPGGCVTDPQGVVNFTGIPEGTYTWRVAWPDSGELEGTIEVHPGSPAKVEITLP